MTVAITSAPASCWTQKNRDDFFGVHPKKVARLPQAGLPSTVWQSLSKASVKLILNKSDLHAHNKASSPSTSNVWMPRGATGEGFGSPVLMPLDLQRKNTGEPRLHEPASMAGPRQWHRIPPFCDRRSTRITSRGATPLIFVRSRNFSTHRRLFADRRLIAL